MKKLFSNDLERGKRYFVGNPAMLTTAVFTGSLLSCNNDFALFDHISLKDDENEQIPFALFWDLSDFESTENFCEQQSEYWQHRAEQMRDAKRYGMTVCERCGNLNGKDCANCQ